MDGLRTIALIAGPLVLLWAAGVPLLQYVRGKLSSGASALTTDEILAFLPRLASWCDSQEIDGHHTWIAIRQRCSEIDTPLPGDTEATQ